MGQTWTNAGAPSSYFTAVACSANGSTWIAIGGRIGCTVSTNYGETWNGIESSILGPNCVACSADASKVFCGTEEVAIYSSTNSGLTWTTNELPSGSAAHIACSADGSRVAVGYLPNLDGGAYSNILYSSNSGATFTSNTVPILYLRSIVSSADGSKLVASPSFGGLPFEGIYRSADFGMTWVETTAPVLGWDSIACSADGTTLAAVTFPGLWLSTNSGLTWISNSASFYYRAVVACSADGTRLVVAGLNSPIYASLDSGNTWTTNNAPSIDWTGLAMSADGSLLLACEYLRNLRGTYPGASVVEHHAFWFQPDALLALAFGGFCAARERGFDLNQLGQRNQQRDADKLLEPSYPLAPRHRQRLLPAGRAVTPFLPNGTANLERTTPPPGQLIHPLVMNECAFLAHERALLTQEVFRRRLGNGNSNDLRRGGRLRFNLPVMRILSGIQPSGALHLGNYFGMMKPAIELQDQGEALYFIARRALAGR